MCKSVENENKYEVTELAKSKKTCTILVIDNSECMVKWLILYMRPTFCKFRIETLLVEIFILILSFILIFIINFCKLRVETLLVEFFNIIIYSYCYCNFYNHKLVDIFE